MILGKWAFDQLGIATFLQNKGWMKPLYHWQPPI